MGERENPSDRFRREARRPRGGLAGEFWCFLCHNKKWWLLPILLAVLVLGLLVLLSGSGLGAFMYTVF